MFYWFRISTNANVTQADPTITRLPLDKGRITRVAFGFPPGPQGLLHLQVARGEHQLWPRNPTGNIAWDDNLYATEEWFDLDEEPYELVARTWNDDDAFSHELVVAITVTPQRVLDLEPAETSILRRLERVLLGRR